MRRPQINYKVVLETAASCRYSNFLPLVRAQNASYSRGREPSATVANASDLVLFLVTQLAWLRGTGHVIVDELNNTPVIHSTRVKIVHDRQLLHVAS
jgi:hypothetical protein